MNVSDFERSGIQLSVTERGRLGYSAQKGVITSEVLDQLRQNKTTLIEELESQRVLLDQKVTGVTDQPGLVTDVNDRNITRSDGSDGCDGYNQFSIEQRHIPTTGGVYSSPYKKSVQTPHTRHIHHSGNKTNNLTRHSTRNDPSPSVTAKEILDSEGIDVRYISEPKRVESALEELMRAEVLGLDIETAKLAKYSDREKAALDPYLSRIRLVQICNDNTAYIFDLDSIKLQSLAPVFKHPMVAHNAVFEMKHLLHAGLELENINCTELMANALDGNLPSLADLAQDRLGWKISKELQTSDWSAKDLSPDQINYAALDAVAALRLYEVLYEELNDKNVLGVYELMLRATKPIAQLELNGICFNLEAHKKLIVGWEPEKEAAEKDLRQLFGPDLNPNSGPQLSSWFKKNLDAETLRKWPRTKTGRLGTSAKVLSNLDHPLVEPLLKYKAVSKLLSTYGIKYASHVNPKTRRIHANFRLGGTKTGRLSCESPNIQNPPTDKDFRALFFAPPGKTLVVADYGQIELRVAALVSEDDVMLGAYENGQDLHKKTASEISGVPFDQVTKEQRQKAKAVNFGLLYGQGYRGLAGYARAEFGVSMSEQEAKMARTAFFRTYKKLARWQQRTGRLSRRENKITTPGGRVRDFRKEKNGYRYTEALNTPIQGGAAEVLLVTLKVLQKHLKGVDAKLVNTIHDEIVLEVASEDSQKAVTALEAAMTEGMLTIFPKASTKNLVDANMGLNWAEAK